MRLRKRPKRGAIRVFITANCGNCRKIEITHVNDDELGPESVLETEQAFESAGWSHFLVLGWACPACSTKLRSAGFTDTKEDSATS